MKNKPITHVAILLDKSGSMGNPDVLGESRAKEIKTAAIAGFNEQIQQIKENAVEQDIRAYLITFNGEVFEHVWGEQASSLTEVTADDYIPKGGTAMRDAIGFTIQKLLDTTDPNESDNVAYLVYVISDGQTYNDKAYSVDKLRSLVKKVQKTGNWTITYMLGCDDSYLKEVSRQTGVALSNMAKWSNSDSINTCMAFDQSTKQSAKYFASRGMGLKASSTYMNDKIGVAADFTSDNPVTTVDVPYMINPTTNEPPLDWSRSTVEKSFSPTSIIADDVVESKMEYSLTNHSNGSKSVFGNCRSVQWKHRPY